MKDELKINFNHHLSQHETIVCFPRWSRARLRPLNFTSESRLSIKLFLVVCLSQVCFELSNVLFKFSF